MSGPDRFEELARKKRREGIALIVAGAVMMLAAVVMGLLPIELLPRWTIVLLAFAGTAPVGLGLSDIMLLKEEQQ